MGAFKWAERTQNSLDTYEIVLSRLALDFAHYTDINQFSTEDFEASSMTTGVTPRRPRAAIASR